MHYRKGSPVRDIVYTFCGYCENSQMLIAGSSETL